MIKTKNLFFLSLRRLETKTLVSRTISLMIITTTVKTTGQG